MTPFLHSIHLHKVRDNGSLEPHISTIKEITPQCGISATDVLVLRSPRLPKNAWRFRLPLPVMEFSNQGIHVPIYLALHVSNLSLEAFWHRRVGIIEYCQWQMACADNPLSVIEACTFQVVQSHMVSQFCTSSKFGVVKSHFGGLFVSNPLAKGFVVPDSASIRLQITPWQWRIASQIVGVPHSRFYIPGWVVDYMQWHLCIVKKLELSFHKVSIIASDQYDVTCTLNRLYILIGEWNEPNSMLNKSAISFYTRGFRFEIDILRSKQMHVAASPRYSRTFQTETLAFDRIYAAILTQFLSIHCSSTWDPQCASQCHFPQLLHITSQPFVVASTLEHLLLVFEDQNWLWNELFCFSI